MINLQPKNTKNYTKLLLLVSYFSVIITVLLLREYPVTGYEQSIYASTPKIAWVFLFFNLLIGIIISVNKLMKVPKEIDALFMVGLLLIVINVVAIAKLTSIKGYYYPSYSDEFSHLGKVNDIISFGGYSSELIYPFFHVFVAVTSIITDIPTVKSLDLLGIIVYLFFIVTIFLLSRHIFKNDRERGIATLVSTTIIFVVYNRMIVQTISVLFLPLFYYLFFKSRDQHQYMIIFIIMQIIIPFMHPSTTIVLIISLFLTTFIWLIYDKIHCLHAEKYHGALNTMVAPMVILIVCLLWFWKNNAFWAANILHVVGWIQDISRDSLIGTQVMPAVETLSLSFIKNIELFFRIYGDEFICICFLIMVTLNIAFKFVKKAVLSKEILALSIFSALCLILEFIQDIRPITGLHVGRYLDFIVVTAPILIAYYFSNLKKRYSKLRITVVIPVLMFFLAVAGTTGLYRSSSTYLQNLQVTKYDVTSINWFMENKATGIKPLVITLYSRYLDGIYGWKQASQLRMEYPESKEIFLPDHFGYNNGSVLGSLYPDNRYMLLSVKDLNYYIDVVPMSNRYTSKDFEYITYDSTVSELYDNGEVWVYSIYSLI